MFPFRKTVSQLTHREALENEMKESMSRYADALFHYQQYLANDFDSGSPFAQMLACKVEGYRVQYYQLRVEFEEKYGNASLFQEKLHTFFMWQREANIKCIIQQPVDSFTQKSVLAQENLFETLTT